MKSIRLFLTMAAAMTMASAADSPEPAKNATANAAAAANSARVSPGRSTPGLPPVLRPTEPPDSSIVQLPGPPAPAVQPQAPPPAPKPVAAVPKRPFVPIQEVAVHRSASIPLLPPAPALPVAVHFDTPAVLQPPKKTYPAGFERDSALFCQKRIGEWKEPDARAVFGDSLRQRAAFDDDNLESGRIYAFTDPTGQYKEMELDFAKDTGLLRTVFVYPRNLTWIECRKLWGGNVSAAQANKGRKFYSYLNRRLDVLVDPTGKVISLGLY